jgi:DNA-binding transcriptional MerR regulator
MKEIKDQIINYNSTEDIDPFTNHIPDLNEDDNYVEMQEEILSDSDGTFSYGEVAKMLDIDTNNLRYYVDQYIEFINPKRSSSAKRGKYRFTNESIDVLKTIFKCRENNLKKDEIIEVLKGESPPPLLGNEDLLKHMRNFAEIFASTYSQKTLAAFAEQLKLQSNDEVNKLTVENDRLSKQLIERDKYIEDLISLQRTEQAKLFEHQNEILSDIRTKFDEDSKEEKPTSLWGRFFNKK